MLLPLLMLAGNDRYINRIYEEYGKWKRTACWYMPTATF